MSQVVQAKCPHCQNTLRIPEEWLDKTMRCKFCKRTFQAKMKPAAPSATNGTSAAPAAPVPTAPVPAKPKSKVASAVTILERSSPAPSLAAPQAIMELPKAAPKPQPKLPPKAPPAANSGNTSKTTSPSQPAADNPFGFDNAPAEPTPNVAKRSKSGVGALILLVLMFFVLFLLGAAGAGFVVYKVVTMPTGPDEKKPVAKGDAAKSDVAKGDAANTDAAKTDGNPVSDKTPDKATADSGAAKDDKDKTPPVTDIGTPKDKDQGKKPPPSDLAKKDKKDGKKPPPFSNDPFPRRALLINVNNYLMYNTVHHGTAADSVPNGYPGSSTSVLRDKLNRLPLNFPASQITELSDGIPAESKTSKPHSTQKSVIETTIRDFVASSRAQDRIIILFAGHGALVDEKAYLVPIDGNTKEPDSLVPLKWVYEQLAKCPAQQKILILDTFRFSPSKGFELPSPGEGAEGTMPEGFDKELQNPPAGVQVWCACQKDQSSIEGERGSAFMNALCGVLSGNAEMRGFSAASDPIPVEDLVVKVNLRLKDLLMAEKRTQVTRLTGKAAANVAYNKDEPMPPALTLKAPKAAGGEAADMGQVSRILDELKILPPVRDTRAGDFSLLKPQNLPAFSAKKLESYKPDGYQDLNELKKKFKAGPDEFAKEFPLRAAYFEALEALQDSSKLKPREVISRADTDPKRKALFLQEQEPLGISIFKLKQALVSLKAAGEKRDTETSKRWHANFDYTQARLQARLVYLFEYNYTLGQIRNDNLPELAPTQTGWRVGISGTKISVTEREAKDLAKANVGLWKTIQDEYPGTPWALLAQRESVISLGLAWRPKSD